MDKKGNAKLAVELTRVLRHADVDTALKIMQWELGDLTKAFTHMGWRPDERLKPGYETEARIALGDLLFQIHVVAGLNGWEVEDLIELGIRRFRDRIGERVGKTEKKGLGYKHEGD